LREGPWWWSDFDSGRGHAGNAAASQQGAAATEDLAPGVGRRASVRDQRRTAAAQIHRSLKAWRSEKGEEDAEASRAPAEGSKEGEEDAAPAPKKEEAVNAKLLRLVHGRSDRRETWREDGQEADQDRPSLVPQFGVR